MKLKVGQYYLSTYYSVQRIVEEDANLGQYRFKSNAGQYFSEDGACRDNSDYRYSLMVRIPKDKIEGLMALAYFKEPEPTRPRKPALDTLQAMAEAAEASKTSQKSHLLFGAFSFYGATDDGKDLTAWAAPKP